MAEPPRPPADLDALLDAALARFSEAEPPPGAAARWLATAPALARERARHPRAWLTFAATFAAGIVAAGIVFLGSHPPPAPAVPHAVALLPPPRRSEPAAPLAPPHRAAVSAWRPFPLPEPLTPQERLAQALTQPPAAAPGQPAPSLVMLAAPEAMYKPIEIRPLPLVALPVLADDAMAPDLGASAPVAPGGAADTEPGGHR